MSKVIDLMGKKFGMLTVLRRSGSDKHGTAEWMCKCECGNFAVVRGTQLTKGKCKSCGCQRHKGTHGESKTRLYRTWRHMLERCLSPSCKSYSNYGARGIKVCSEWMLYAEFRNWALSNGYNDSLSIDRINSSGNYEPSNCRWATYLVQNNNTRRNHFVLLENKKMTISQVAHQYGINKETLRHRIEIGIPIKRAIL